MRRPTSRWESLKWWRDAIEGRDPPTHDGIPECGFFEMREIKGGPRVPVKIEIKRPVLHPETGELEEPEEMVAIVAHNEVRNPVSLWLSLTPITRESYDRLIRMQDDQRMRRTRVKLDLAAAPTRRK